MSKMCFLLVFHKWILAVIEDSYKIVHLCFDLIEVRTRVGRAVADDADIHMFAPISTWPTLVQTQNINSFKLNCV